MTSKRTKLHKFEFKPLSWSAISSFQYDPEQWYRKYCQGIKDEPTKEMFFGNEIGRKLESDPTFLPELPRLKIYEQKLEGKVGDIHIIGFLDMFQHKPYIALGENKTSSNKTRWTQKKAEDHGQLLFYLLLIYLNYQYTPEQVTTHLHYIPVRETGSFGMELDTTISMQSFRVYKTATDILKFGGEIKRVYQQMIEYADEKNN